MIPRLKKGKTLRRRLALDEGQFVISIDQHGVSIRAANKQTSVRLSFHQLALQALIIEGYTLSDDEHSCPLATLSHLYHHKRH